jgi:hypothetical protein
LLFFFRLSGRAFDFRALAGDYNKPAAAAHVHDVTAAGAAVRTLAYRMQRSWTAARAPRAAPPVNYKLLFINNFLDTRRRMATAFDKIGGTRGPHAVRRPLLREDRPPCCRK